MPPLGLRGTWKGHPSLDRGWAQSSRARGLSPPQSCATAPPSPSLPLHPRPSRQIPGGARMGGGGPAARPASPGSQSGLCLRQPGAQRSRRGPGLGRGPGQVGREVQWHRREPGPGGAGVRAQLRLLPALCPALGNWESGPGRAASSGKGRSAPNIPAGLVPRASAAAFRALGNSAEALAEGCLPSTHRALPPTSGIETPESR